MGEMSKSKKNTSCKDALAAWKKKTGENPAEVACVKFTCQRPPIKSMDSRVLNQFVQAEQISLSTNAIEKIGSLDLQNLKILSLGRNNIKKLENCFGGIPNLEELWISYNQIDKLTGIQDLQKLKVLYM